jgi:FMN-dependent NADH-azoreductase
MKILHVDSSFLGSQSVTRELSAATVAQLRKRFPAVTVTYRDLAAQPPAHLDGTLLGALQATDPASLPAAVRADAIYAEALLNEFLEADTVVIGTPMYNFAIPTQLKAWIDRLARAGRTFRYTAAGPEGLAGGKQLILVSSRGGAYAGTPFEAALDHQEAYLRAIFGFFGITDVAVIRAEGVNLGPEARAAGIAKALDASMTVVEAHKAA